MWRFANTCQRGKSGDVYNFGASNPRRNLEVVESILTALGKPSTLKQTVPERPGHDRRYLLDHSKITSEIGWQPQISLDQGLASTIAWYKQNKLWWSRRKRDVVAELDEFAWRPAVTR